MQPNNVQNDLIRPNLESTKVKLLYHSQLGTKFELEISDIYYLLDRV